MALTTVVRTLLVVLSLGLVPALAAQAADVKILPAAKNEKGYATGDMIIGKADAPVTVIEYASMTCPHCAAFHAEELPKIKSEFIDTGKARLVFREFPLDGFALRGAMVARCAGPDRYFAMLDVLFKQQMVWSRPAKDAKEPLAELQKIARLAGIGEQAFQACMNDQALADEIVARRQEGDKTYQIKSTPGFVVNGKTLERQKLSDAINEALKAKG
jgi:protein-disulfide isomerase